MGLYKLIRGSHTTGSGENIRRYRANDPKNCIVESPINLAVEIPEKFIRYNGKRPLRSGMAPGEVDPPRPAVPKKDVLDDLAPMTAEQRRRRAEQLRKRAEELEEIANDQESAEDSDVNEEAFNHVRSSFAKSDSAEEFEEEGRKLVEEREESMSRAANRRPTPKALPQDEEGGEDGSEAQEGEDEALPEASEGGEEEQPVDDGLETQSIPQLRAFAKSNRVDVSKAKTRNEMISAIRTSRAGKQ